MEQTEVRAKSHALEFVVAATQILTSLCLFEGNPVRKGSLALLFFGGAFELFYKNRQCAEELYRQVGAVFLAAGLALMLWFGVAG